MAAQRDETDHNFWTDEAWRLTANSLGLSARESEIARQVINDRGDGEIARTLAISPHTVHAHLQRIFTKLGVTSRVELLNRVYREYFVRQSGGMPSMPPNKGAPDQGAPE